MTVARLSSRTRTSHWEFLLFVRRQSVARLSVAGYRRDRACKQAPQQLVSDAEKNNDNTITVPLRTISNIC